jgi:lauroyl/myristoyl acyltransferase
VKNVGTLTFRFIATLADAAPGPVRGFIVELCAFGSWALSPAKRRNAAVNIAMAGRAATRSAVYDIFRFHATNIYELFASSRWPEESLSGMFEIEGREELDRALAAGHGVVLVTAHVGSWELGALYLRSLGYALHVVAGVQMNRFLTGAVKEAKERRGIEVINPDGSYRKILKVFQSNGVLALLADGNVFSGGVERAFFGRPARVPDGPARLAKAAGAPIVVGWCRRLGARRFSIRTETIVDANEVDSLGEEEMLSRVYGALERLIAANADQWCMFRRIWEA